MGTHAPVTHFFRRDPAEHLGVEVGQAEGSTREAYGHGIVGIEAKEPDAGLASVRDVGADVELWETRETRDCWEEPWPHALHAKRHDTQPRRPVERVELQRWRDERPQGGLRHRPVHK